MFWNFELIKGKTTTKKLDEFAFNNIESLGNNPKQPNEDTPVTIEKLKERLTILLGKEKLLNETHGGNNSYLEMQKNDNLSKIPIINKKSKPKFETNIWEKLKGYTKIDTFDTFYESFLEIKYSACSKLENFKEETEKPRSLEWKILF